MTSTSFSFRKFCSDESSISGANTLVVMAYSLNACINAYGSYNAQNGNGSRMGVTYNADLTSSLPSNFETAGQNHELGIDGGISIPLRRRFWYRVREHERVHRRTESFHVVRGSSAVGSFGHSSKARSENVEGLCAS